PDQVLPATSTFSTITNERVKLHLDERGAGSIDPISIPGLDYEKSVRTCAKAFLRLGLERHHSVCIIGFNAPEWFFSNLGAIYAGGLSAGMYTTNSADACQYCAEKSKANIIVVENKQQLEKILKFKDSLKDLKAIVQYDGEPEEEGVISWKELMKIGEEVDDAELDNVMKMMCINECCSILFTSGTVGKPKAVMFSHDNITWSTNLIVEFFGMQDTKEVLVSYLPLNHIAGQIIDIYLTMKSAATGSLLNTLQEARPTRFFGVPRIWEKIYEKMQKVTAESGKIKGMIASWAMQQGLQHYMQKMNGIDSNTFSYQLSKMLVFNKIKQTLGFDRCLTLITGAAPISTDIKKFYLSKVGEYSYEGIGKDRPGIYTKIANPDEDGNGEVCMKGRHIFMGYIDEPEKTNEALQDQWLYSGDIGKIDTDGFLAITVLIEEEIKKELPCIRNAMVVGDRRKYLTVLLTMKTEVNIQTGEPLDELTSDTKEWCKAVGCEVNTVKDIMSGPKEKIMAAIQKGINEANARAMSNAQKVQKFDVLPHDFSIPTGELGPTMKLMRNVVAKKYARTIEKLYEES
ncbi:Long-chain-fatty-acid--CoA ligase ACSBG2, partial [Blattella germanica]